MAKGVPPPPSKAEIAAQTKEQEARLTFENEKRSYLTQAGSYDIMSQTNIDRQRNSLQYNPNPTGLDMASLYIPKFNPTTSDITSSEMQGYDWMKAENLGFAGYNDPQMQQQRDYNMAYYTALQTIDQWGSRNPSGAQSGSNNFWNNLNLNTYRNQDLTSTDISEGKYKRPSSGSWLDKQITTYLGAQNG